MWEIWSQIHLHLRLGPTPPPHPKAWESPAPPTPFVPHRREADFICRQPGRAELRVSIKPFYIAACSRLSDQFISACCSFLHSKQGSVLSRWGGAVSTQHTQTLPRLFVCSRAQCWTCQSPENNLSAKLGDSHVHIWCCSGRCLMCSVTQGGLQSNPCSFPSPWMLAQLEMCSPSLGAAVCREIIEQSLEQKQGQEGVCFSSDLKTEMISLWSICIFLAHWYCEHEFFTQGTHYFLGRMIRSLLLLCCLPSNF